MITDAQARYNLRNVFDEQTGKLVPAEVAALGRLCEAAGLASGVAEQLANAFAAASLGAEDARCCHARSGNSAGSASTMQPCACWRPTSCCSHTHAGEPEHGVQGGDRSRDRRHPADAARLVQLRQQAPFKTLEDAKKNLPPATVLNARQVGVGSQFFEVRGQLRLGDRVLQERSLVQRRIPRSSPSSANGSV